MLKTIKRSGFIGIIAILLSFVAYKCWPDTDAYLVTKVADGDTITALDAQQRKVKVRLYGIDAPEKNQTFGQESRKNLSDLTLNKYIKLVIKDKDRYGRTVAQVILPDGRNANYLQVESGMAWHYVAYSNDPRLAALEIEARAAKRGLWVGKRPQAPWLYRKQRRR